MISIQTGLIDPDDFFLIGVESLIVIGVLGALIFAYLVQSRHPKLTSHGWNIIVFGLFFILVHSVFDVFDTMQWDDLLVDFLNVLDGATFVIGLILFALGIYKIAEFGAEQWEL